MKLNLYICSRSESFVLNTDSVVILFSYIACVHNNGLFSRTKLYTYMGTVDIFHHALGVHLSQTEGNYLYYII